MKIDVFITGGVVAHMTPEEFDILSQALLLMDFASISVEKNIEKLKLLDSMIEDVKKINIKESL